MPLACDEGLQDVCGSMQRLQMGDAADEQQHFAIDEVQVDNEQVDEQLHFAMDEVQVDNEQTEEQEKHIMNEGKEGDRGAWQCAICLDDIALPDLASVPGCEHYYCVGCILQWTTLTSGESCCPTCKIPFSSLVVYRNIDGSVTDHPITETSALLARSAWFQAWRSQHQQACELTKQPVFRSVDAATGFAEGTSRTAHAIAEEEWAEEAMYEYFEDQYDDEDLEDYYLSRSPGNRPVLGNRRWGPNGYVQSGRKLAAPVQSGNSRGHRKKGMKGSNDTAAKASGDGASSSRGAGPGQSSKPTGGRRAQRKARRCAADKIQRWE